MADEQQEDSPWDSPSPSYKAVPPTNPKTNEPVQLYVCTACGVAVVSRKIHNKWHRGLSGGSSWP